MFMLDGLVLNLIRERADSSVPGMALHIVHNTAVVIVVCPGGSPAVDSPRSLVSAAAGVAQMRPGSQTTHSGAISSDVSDTTDVEALLRAFGISSRDVTSRRCKRPS